MDGDLATGGDHDSVGLFQQRASWGTLAERMDPTASTRLFVTRLLAVPAWQTMAPGVAAQIVQRSAYPAPLQCAAQSSALEWLNQIMTSPGAAACGADGLPAARPGSISAGRAAGQGYTIPA